MSERYRHSDGSYQDSPEVLSERDKYLNERKEVEFKPTHLNELREKASIGVKHDNGKPRTELIPTEFIIEVAKALTFGANKYGDNNFRNGLSYTRLLGAAKRHIELELAGIEQDSESTHSHLAHAGASLAMYAFMKAHRLDLDDRFKYSKEEKQKLEEMMYGKKNN